MKRKKDWRKYLNRDEWAEINNLEQWRDDADTTAREARIDIRKIMTRCWARMKRDK